MIELRDYQLEVVSRVRAAYQAGRVAPCLVMPTGAGKTATAAAMVRMAVDKGGTVLWLAGRRELIDQAADTLREGAGVDVGVVMSGRSRRRLAPVQVASVDTLRAWGEIPKASFVIFDEAHGALAETRLEILRANAGARILGLTATPQRADGTALGNVFDALVLGPTVRELTDWGRLVEAEIVYAEPSARKTLAKDPVEAWQGYSDGRPGFLFAPSVKASKDYAERLAAAGIPAKHIDGRTPKQERRQVLDGFRVGRIDVLSSFGVYREGTDAPRAQICMLAQPVGTVMMYLQCVGRVLRPHNGKETARVIDLVGAVHDHGLPDSEWEWTLDGDPVRKVDRAQAVAQCPRCGATWKAGRTRVCFVCQYQLPEREMLQIQERELKRMTEPEKQKRRRKGPIRPNASREEQMRFLERYRKTQEERGYKAGWIAHRMAAMFGGEADDWKQQL